MNEKTALQLRIESGKQILIAEISPPKSGKPDLLRDRTQRYSNKVHALGVSDNRDGVCMSALAASALVAKEGIEPIQHIVTRDRNRIALVSDCLGAQALGVRNFLCTTGVHQTLGPAGSAKNVFDVDSTQLLQILANIASDGSVVGEARFEGAGPFCLGAVANPYADPPEMQVMRLNKKAVAGANFAITQPVFDLDRFNSFWNAVVERGLHEKIAIVAGIRILGDHGQAKVYAESRPSPSVPDAILKRLSGGADAKAQQGEGIQIAIETIHLLSQIEGLRGFEVVGDGNDDAVLQVIEEAGLGAD